LEICHSVLGENNNPEIALGQQQDYKWKANIGPVMGKLILFEGAFSPNLLDAARRSKISFHSTAVA